MAVGTIETSVLTDIANAIRFQAGVATLFTPGEMAAAVTALDGTNEGNYQAQIYMTLESGILSGHVFEDIADAIRGQNGSTDTYLPGEMAAVILALSWDAGLKPRAVLTSLGTLEFNYVDGRHCYSGGVPVDAWEVDPAGYSSASARPYDSVKLQVQKVVFHSSWAQVGMTNANYLPNAFESMTEVSVFENMSGMRSANQMFGSCSMLETIYATSFSNSGLSGPLMFNGCSRLVGGTDGFVPSTTSGASVCKIGAGGVLTDPNKDARTWFYGHFYEDGEAVLTAAQAPDPSRTPRQPLRRYVDALHILVLLCADVARLQGLRPVGADGPVLHVRWGVRTRGHLRRLHVGATIKRGFGGLVLLQPPQPGRRERHGMVQLSHFVHVLPHRHGEHARLFDGTMIVRL